MTVGLGEFVSDFATAMESVDSKGPQAVSHRDPKKTYRPGIGPFGEDAAVAMTVTQMRLAKPDLYPVLGKRRYPTGATTCDLALGDEPEWAIEVKLARVGRDNGTYEDTAVKKVLSPYEDDRSAVTDCLKLASSAFTGRKAVLIYGFDDPRRPLQWMIDAFELIARQRGAQLGNRNEATLRNLVHPVFGSGCVFAWEILPPTCGTP